MITKVCVAQEIETLALLTVCHEHLFQAKKKCRSPALSFRSRTDDDEVLRTCREFLHTHNDALHPSNIHVARLLELAFDACVNLQRWSEALDFGEKTLESYQ